MNRAQSGNLEGQNGAIPPDGVSIGNAIRFALDSSSARLLALEIGISRRSIRRFLGGEKVGKKTAAQLRAWQAKRSKPRKARNRRYKGVKHPPGLYVVDAI